MSTVGDALEQFDKHPGPILGMTINHKNVTNEDFFSIL